MSNYGPRAMPDYETQTGAARLARSLVNFWADRGYLVRTQVLQTPITSGGHDHYMVRSDMVNGMPRRKIKPAAEVIDIFGNDRFCGFNARRAEMGR